MTALPGMATALHNDWKVVVLSCWQMYRVISSKILHKLQLIISKDKCLSHLQSVCSMQCSFMYKQCLYTCYLHCPFADLEKALIHNAWHLCQLSVPW